MRSRVPGGGLAIVLVVLSACATAPSDGTIDVLDYVLGAAETWPRFGDRPVHHQHQVVDLAARRVTFVKYTLPWSYERWSWDDAWIRHEVDHAIDGVRWVHYIFDDGRWLPRRLRKGETWSLDLPANQSTWFDAACNPETPQPAPYRVSAWHAGMMDAGGDLGMRDVIVLSYQPNPAGAEPNSNERFYFAKGAGWYRWTRGLADVQFNRIGGVARQPAPLCERDFQP
jgi:hypothetical protein